MAAKPKTEPTAVFAGMLNASEHIGTIIRFGMYDDNRQTSTIVTAELRQIYHKSDETVINVGNGAVDEHVLTHSTVIVLNPDAQIVDIAELQVLP